MANKIKLKRAYTAPRSAYIANISVPDETPTRANINSINQAYSDARQQVNNVIAQYELDKRKSLLQDSMSRNIANEKILSIGAGQRPIDTRQLNNLIFNRPAYKAGGSVGRKRYAVGGSLSNRINRRNYWFDENDGVVEFNSDTPTPSENTDNIDNTDNTSESNSVVTIGTKSFASAFKQARTAGLDKFRWRGKTYTTEMAGENRSGSSNVSEPTNVPKRTTTGTPSRLRRREKSANTTAQQTRKSNKQDSSRGSQRTNTTRRSNPSRTSNNPNDAVRVPYSRTNDRITGQLPNVTVTARGKSQPKNRPVMSWRDYVDAAKKDPSIKNTSGYKNARKQEFERMRTRAAGPGTTRWANNKQPGQGNPGYQTRYRGNDPFVLYRRNGVRSVGNSW